MVRCFLILVLVFGGCSDTGTDSLSGEPSTGEPALGFGGQIAPGGIPGGTPSPAEPSESAEDASLEFSDVLADTELSDITEGEEEESDGSELEPEEADVSNPGDGDAEDTTDTDESEESWIIDVSNVECLFIPEVAEFAPVLECQWSGSLESSKHDDVVMTPAVANLTDDDMDGDVDIQDIPDIAFISYRYQEDGCCSAPGVLRIVSGSCSKEGASVVLQSNELQEHTTVNAVELDNSGGLVLGDVDHDGQMEIFAMRKNSGSVLFSGIEYPDAVGSTLEYDSAQWSEQGILNPVLGLQLADEDDSALSTEVPGAQLMANPTLPAEPAALAQLRVRVRARAVDGTSKIATRLIVGEGANQVVLDSPARTVSSVEYQTFRFEFAKNPATGELRQWKYADLESLKFGAFHAGSQGTGVVVTELVLEMGAVYIEWKSDFPKENDMARGAQPSMVDVNQDGIAELLVGRTLIDPQTGEAIWVGDADGD